MTVPKNPNMVSGWEDRCFRSAIEVYVKLKTWRGRQQAALTKHRIADLMFILRSEIRNLKYLALSEDAKEACQEWRTCALSLVEYRKALRAAEDNVSQAKLRDEYVTLKERYRQLRKRFRSLEAQAHAPINVYLAQLQEIKNRIVSAAGDIYLKLKIEFYLILTKAKEIIKIQVQSPVSHY